MYIHGWYKVAFEYELEKELTAAAVGDIRLVLVRKEGRIHAYSADCPHRGANLALGGRLKDTAIICPFHGYRIGLGRDSDQGFGIREYETVTLGGAVFVRLSNEYDNGFAARMQELAEANTIVPAFIMPVNAPAALVTENGYDSAHFLAVHGILKTTKFDVIPGEHGELIVESQFNTLTGYKQSTWAPYRAETFSPGLIYVFLQGEVPYGVLTGTTPITATTSTIRLSLLFPKSFHGEKPDETFCRQLIGYSRMALDDDHLMWANLSPTVIPKFTARDEPILKFHQFCAQFAQRETA